jgi:hypothetical protein
MLLAFPNATSRRRRRALLLVFLGGDDADDADDDDGDDDDDDDDDDGTRTLTLTIINRSFLQPFSPFFVMVHNSKTVRLYVRGQPASEPLALLAVNGTPG